MRSPDSLRGRQDVKLRALLGLVLRSNRFYRARLEPLGLAAAEPPGLERLGELPFTDKLELAEDQERNPPFGTDLSYPEERFTRLHLTSGTTGRSLRWLDTPESWRWFLSCWREVYRAAGVGPGDRIFVAFSFGPFLGFWGAFEAAQELGAMALTGGGLSSEQRLRSLEEHRATVLVATPTYALRLAQAAQDLGVDPAATAVRVGIYAGEPGAGVPNVRARLEAAWGARCYDHAGATEVGAWGYGCGHGLAMHVNEEEFVAEVIDPKTGEPAPTDTKGRQAGELVMTNLGRVGSPVIRYRTGDFVRLSRARCACGRETAVLDGGVLGRVDDMLIVRGVNVYPAALENLIRGLPEIGEFEVRAQRRREMVELLVRVEVAAGEPDAVAAALGSRIRERLGLRARVEVVASGSLPRYELKARRFRMVEDAES